MQAPFVNPMIASMDSTININFSIEPRRLWPIEISGNILIFLLLVVQVIGIPDQNIQKFLVKFRCGIWKI